MTDNERTTEKRRFDQLNTGDRIYWSGCVDDVATVTRGYNREDIDAPTDIEITFAGEDKTHTCALEWKASTPVNVYVD